MRRRLFLVTLAVTTLLVAAFALPLAVLVRDVARDRAITDAERDEAVLAPVLAGVADERVLEALVEGTASGADGRLAVVLPDGTQVGDRRPVDHDALALARDGSAFSRQTGEGVDVYLPVVAGDQDVVVMRTRVPDELLTDGVAASWGVLGVVAVALLAVSVAATDQLARTVTRPAAELARTSRRLAEGDATARATVSGPPEIAAVAESLNLLADRIDELLVAERERVADLSHRLRTPLTALRLGAEGHGLPDLVADVDRLEVEVGELIPDARRPLHEEVALRTDVAAVARARAEFWGALADDDGRAWRCSVPPSAAPLVRLSADDAAAAIDVLLGNVFAHTEEGVAYEVAVELVPGRVLLAVEDAGSGVEDPRVRSTGGRAGAGRPGWVSTSPPRPPGRLAASCASRPPGSAAPAPCWTCRWSTPCRSDEGPEPAVTPVDEHVRAAIRRRGPLPFAEVVDAALYLPDGGFYASGGRAGRRGDFLTSAEVGPLFGAVVANALDRWWEELGHPAVLPVVEVGAGPGTLAAAVLATAPACAVALRYVLVERSAPQRAEQAARLPLVDPTEAFAPRWMADDDPAAPEPPPGPIVVSLPEPPRLPPPCVVLANELLDNLPFGLAERTAAGWAEVRVGLDGDRLEEVLVPLTTEVDVRLSALAPRAGLGDRAPVAAAARAWVREARLLAGPGGRVVAFDYGRSTAALAQVPWTDWVRTYRRHGRGGHPLEALGSQDITCEVPFDQLDPPSTDRSQSEWLVAHGLEALVEEARRGWRERAPIGDLEAIRARSRVTEGSALTDPTGLGAFRALEWEGR